MMQEINLGSTLRQLRKKKGITQETLAAALSVTPQAVSKWESGVSYPEMTMIPMIAGYFEVSLDTLFDYDLTRVRNKIQSVLDEAWEYFFDDPERYIRTVKAALRDYPDNEALLCALLDAYEHDLRNTGRTDHLDEMIDLSYKIISESQDLERVCSVKDNLSAAYLKLGKYDKAKEVLQSLPRRALQRNDAMAFRLSGQDKLKAAEEASRIHLQDLYIACFEMGNGLYAGGNYQQAIAAYTRGLETLKIYLRPGMSGQDAYLWPGMQTFHWGFHQRRGACHKKLGDTDACGTDLQIARHILQTSWHDYQECRDYYTDAYNEYLAEFDLTEYQI